MQPELKVGQQESEERGQHQAPAGTGREAARFRQILGIRFFVGEPHEAIERIRGGGLLVVPAGPALKSLPHDPVYRAALLNADLALTDSGFMVMIWNRLQGDSIRRLSGLEYLVELLKEPDFAAPHQSFWIMANAESAERNRLWLLQQGIALTPEDIYIAPVYGSTIEDEALLARLNQRRPKHVVVTVGGGKQEPLGHYLKQRLEYLPSIHCIGAAIAFLSGDQVYIPMWADRLYLGWLLRCVSDPGRYLPRYWDARKLFSLMLRYRSSLPAFTGEEAT